MHPRRKHIHQHFNIGDKIADAVVSGMGSWKFIIIQTVIVAIWIILNVWLLSRPFDPYPLILLNLVFSTQAAYASPLILMSQNRAAARDRKRDDVEASEVEQLFGSHELLLQISKQVLQINQQQMDILQLLKNQEHFDTFVGKIEKQEQMQDVILAKLSAALEKKPRARATKQEASE
jgi:uncharacterized membrane protein